MKPPCYGIPKAADSFNESWFSLSATNDSHKTVDFCNKRIPDCFWGKLPISEKRRLRQDGGGWWRCIFAFGGGEGGSGEGNTFAALKM